MAEHTCLIVKRVKIVNHVITINLHFWPIDFGQSPSALNLWALPSVQTLVNFILRHHAVSMLRDCDTMEHSLNAQRRGALISRRENGL